MTPSTDQPFDQTIDEQSNRCFGCGPDNPQGLRLNFEVNALADGTIEAHATVRLTHLHEGAEGYIHGGLIATLMDEVMSKLNRPLGVLAMTRHMEVDYLRPAPVETALTLTGHHLRREGRKLFHSAELSAADGTILARATALFIVIDPAKVAQARLDREGQPA